MKTLPFRAVYNRQYFLKLSFEVRRCLGLRFSGFKALRLEHGGLQSGPRAEGRWGTRRGGRCAFIGLSGDWLQYPA